jgi:hypothetical protein
MADGRQYTITIYDKTSGSLSPIAGSYGKSKDTKENNTTAKDFLVRGWMSLEQVAKYAKRAISHEISMVSLRTGETERQQKMQFTYDILERVCGTAMNIGVGAATGNIVGAVVAAAYEAINIAINIKQKLDRYDTARSLENMSLGLARARSGDSLAYINGGR